MPLLYYYLCDIETQIIFSYRVSGLIQMFLVSLSSPRQVCVHCHGSPGPAADGLPLSEHQPVCGEFPQDGAQTAGVRQTKPADPRNQLCEFPILYY